MADEQMEQSNNEPTFSWTYYEYHPHERGRLWWILFWIVSLGLVVYAGLTQNFLFAVIILIFDIIILYRHYQKPEPIECEIYDHGVVLGEQYLPWKNIKKFWIVYDPPEVKRLYFTYDSVLRPHSSISFNEVNPIELRNFLKQYVIEDLDREDEHFSDTLGRILKI